MGKYSISVSGNIFNAVIEKLTETYGEARGHIQPFVDDAIITKLNNDNPNDPVLRVYFAAMQAEKIKYL